MNNLLTREIPLPCTIRLWDTYLAESDGFATFQLYVCAAFLLHWREKLMLERDFQGLMILLQNVPTQNWTDSNISLLVAEAYRLKFAFADAPNHLHNAAKSDRWRVTSRWFKRFTALNTTAQSSISDDVCQQWMDWKGRVLDIRLYDAGTNVHIRMGSFVL